jgi:hypothetical protein
VTPDQEVVDEEKLKKHFQKPVKHSQSVRDEIYEQIKANLYNSKKLQEIQQRYTMLGVKIDFSTLLHQAKVQAKKESQKQ